MPKQTAKTPLADKLNRALANHAADETDYGTEFVDLPGGISGGVAKFVDGRVGTYKSGANEGEPFLYLAGVVIEPRTAVKVTKVFQDGKVQVVGSEQVTVQGQRTSQVLPLCETTNRSGDVRSLDENVERALNEVRKIGGEECTAEVGSLEDLTALMDTLKEAAPYFRFSTSSSDPTEQYPNPRVWENWHGSRGLEDYEAEEGEDVEDETEEPEPPPKKPAGKGKKPPAPPEPEEDAADDGGDDLSTLAEAADAGDEDAQTRINELALEAGVDQGDIDNAEDWTSVVGMMESSSDEDSPDDDGDDGTPEDEEEDDWAPEKEEVYLYKPPRARKAVECEVTAVFAGKQTVNLKNLDDGKTYKSVSWEALTEVE